MNFFDCNCMLGPTTTNRENPFDSADALLAEMDKLSIAESLVYSSLAYRNSRRESVGMKRRTIFCGSMPQKIDIFLDKTHADIV